MAFPDGTVIDNFNRTEDPLNSTDYGLWFPDLSSTSFKANGSQCVQSSTGQDTRMYYKHAMSSADCEVRISIPTFPTGLNKAVYLGARWAGLNYSDGTGYFIEFSHGSTYDVRVYKLLAGVQTTINTSLDAFASAPTEVAITITGSSTTTITARGKVSGSWVTGATVNDSSSPITAAGYATFAASDNTGFALDDFVVWPLPSVPTPNVSDSPGAPTDVVVSIAFSGGTGPLSLNVNDPASGTDIVASINYSGPGTPLTINVNDPGTPQDVPQVVVPAPAVTPFAVFDARTPTDGITVVVAGAIQLREIGVAADTFYEIRVRAKNSAGLYSDYTATIAVLTAHDVIPPQVPTNVTAVQGSGAMVQVAWSPSPDSDIAYYNVKRSRVNDPATASLIGQISGTQFIDQ